MPSAEPGTTPTSTALRVPSGFHHCTVPLSSVEMNTSPGAKVVRIAAFAPGLTATSMTGVPVLKLACTAPVARLNLYTLSLEDTDDVTLLTAQNVPSPTRSRPNQYWGAPVAQLEVWTSAPEASRRAITAPLLTSTPPSGRRRNPMASPPGIGARLKSGSCVWVHTLNRFTLGPHDV